MATIDQYKLVLDVQGQQAVDRLSKSLGGLGTTIAGVGFAAFTNSVLQMADAVSDLASATGLAIGDIAAFGGALGQAGGKAEDGSKMIAKFFQTLDDAAQGSDKAQEALKRVGFELSDLTKMSEGKLLNEAIRKLGAMEAGAKRTALGVELFGKSFKSINPKDLAEAMASGDFTKVQDAMEKMGKLADSLAANFYTLQIAGAQVFSDMASAIEPFIGKVENGRLSLDQAEKIIKAVGIGLAIAFGAKTVATIIDIVTVVKSLTTALKGTVIVQTALTALSGPRGWAMIAGGAIAAAAAVYGLNKALGDTNDEMQKATGGGTADTPKKGPAFAEVKLSAKDQAAKTALATAEAATAQMQLQNDEALKLRQLTIETLGLESSFAGAIKSNADAKSKYAVDVKDLQGKILVEQSKENGGNQAIIGQYREQISLKSQQLTETLKLNKAEYDRLQAIQEFTLGVSTDTMLANRAKELELMQQQIAFGTAITAEDQLALKILSLKNEEDRKRIDLLGQLKIAEAANNQAAIDDLMIRSAADKKYYQDRTKLEQDASKKSIENRGNVGEGVEKAMEAMRRATDPIKLAEDATTQLFAKMNEGIHSFVTTGKFGFSDLARSFGQMVAEMMLKQQMMKAAEGVTGFLTKMLGSFFMAEGGPVKGNQPYIVGEQGPELFVPPSAGKIIPNNQMGSKAVSTGMNSSAPVTNNYITNNINALDSKSVAQVFAENRKQLFGTVELARKELTYGVR